MSTWKQRLGKWGEGTAAAYLEKNGYRIWEINAYTPYGEIDIIACKGGITVFVEVKTRGSKSFGFPEESITVTKQEHIINASQAYLAEHPELGSNWQIDVISIQRLKNKAIEIIHFENAISN